MGLVIHGKPIVAGAAEGKALVSEEPLSFWGGYDHQTGEITDRRHPLSGQNASGRILALPFTKGSSTTTAVLLESVRAGTAPSAILVTEVDAFLALASIVAIEMYECPIPIFIVPLVHFQELSKASNVKLKEDGLITIEV